MSEMQSATLALKRKQKKQRQRQRRRQEAAGATAVAEDDGRGESAGSSSEEEGGHADAAGHPGGAHAAALSRLGERASRLNALGFDEEELGFSVEDLAATLRVVGALGRDIAAFRSQPFKDLRREMHPIIEEQMKNYGVKGSDLKRKRKEKDVAELKSLKEQDKEWVNRHKFSKVLSVVTLCSEKYY